MLKLPWVSFLLMCFSTSSKLKLCLISPLLVVPVSPLFHGKGYKPKLVLLIIHINIVHYIKGDRWIGGTYDE